MSYNALTRLDLLPEEIEDKIWKMVHGIGLYEINNEFNNMINGAIWGVGKHDAFARRSSFIINNYNNRDELMLIEHFNTNYLNDLPREYWDKIANKFNIFRYKCKLGEEKHEQYWETYGSGW